MSAPPASLYHVKCGTREMRLNQVQNYPIHLLLCNVFPGRQLAFDGGRDHPAKKAKAIRAGGSAMELFLLAPRLPAH